MKRISQFLILYLFLSFSLLAQTSKVIIELEGNLSGKDFIQTSFANKTYQSTEAVSGQLEAELERPTEISFYHLKNNGKILSRKSFWIGEGTYQIQGKIDDLSTLRIEPEHPYTTISNQISQSEGEIQKSLIVENLDKEVGLNWLISQANSFTKEELQETIPKISDELKQLNSYKRFIADLSLDEADFGAKEGEISQNFTLESRAGNKFSLDDFKGKYRLLEFSFSGCKPCLEALPEIRGIHEEFGEELEIISIWNDKRKEVWLNSSKKHKEQITWTDLWDETGYVTKLYQIEIFPTYILIDPSGNIDQIWKGYIKGRILRKMEGLFSKPIP
ncbi:peroxiredoxin family protein [Algoriphagus limi]|uniref:TlpA family protein disulfide reductase n=1 Tax=Algoriphagus limi TaxID=2975273 RepID=A0ABT2G6R7_9BACT|nr:TlpA disulfide reductase family protein [Algoriphagus limi]MCS5490948.1 TlpA family protein disulfide reductase [Algoriphagus limi]